MTSGGTASEHPSGGTASEDASGGTASEHAVSVVNNGLPQQKWNLVVLGDGYRDVELGDFHTHVDDFVETLRATPPFGANWSAINVYRIDVASNESGAD